KEHLIETDRQEKRKAKRMLVLTIFNTGQPLDKEIAEKIFQPYASLKGKGAGMGLFYAQQVVLAHNGTIDVRNTSNGVAFDVKIPV
ncbi:HAMP domain-containing histidine kinase, partial [bacterium]|nr:HAMP domain-containing histidine kinase [bacterium]